MRFLHTSDWHLGFSLSNMPMIEEQKHFAGQILDIARRKKVDAVVIAGDMFDHAVSNPDAIGVYNDTMTRLCMKSGVPVIICAGNHDGAARLSSCADLLGKAGLHIAGSIKNGIPSITLEDATIHILPFFSIEEARYLYPDEEIRNYDMAMRAIIKRLPLGKGRNILAAHCFVSSAEVSESDRSAMVGGANMVGADAFGVFDYVALGHLHKPQDIGENIRYCGSPMKLSFSEAEQEKSVTIVDTSDMSRELVSLSMVNDLRVLKGSYREILERAGRDGKSSDYIKIELADEYAHMELRNTLSEYYPNLLSLAGKEFEGGKESDLSVEQVASLSPLEIMMKFYEEYSGGQQPSEKQVEWFLKALSVKKEGKLQ
ncbi:exonuclease SbcCD subunit D [Christensenella timonensis]|uniref:exonuclease SbcCD subunit D n=1 Tax=Christensenella timonensis TaxID=1816678 RepID=UPI0008342807|nr:exonuclease SbcCD subunit D [Christensenella timonensis]